MDCTCPHCGRKIKNGGFGFDFTPYIQQQLAMAIGYPGLNDDEQGKIRIKGGIDALFNSLSSRDRFIYTQDEILAWTDLKNQSSRMVMMMMPYEKIQILFKSYLSKPSKNTEALRQALDWVEKGKAILSQMCFPLILDKEYEGDIQFNLIRSSFDEKPVVKYRVCPECCGRLSFWSGRFKEICLAVLGGPRVSKTTTLTACANAFMENGGYKGITWQGSRTDPEYRSFEDLYLKKYRRCAPIGATEITGNIPRISFCVHVRDPKTNILAGRLVLTFVDLPGELNGEGGIKDELYARYIQYFKNVDYLWYCTDPGELLQLHETAAKSEKVRELGYESDKRALTLEEISSNMSTISYMFKSAGKSIPVVYILGKTDSSLISPNENYAFHLYTDKKDPEYLIAEQPFEVAFFNEESLRYRGYMFSKNSELVNQFEQNFPEHCYVALSAYGFDPKGGGDHNTLRPFNVEVPFMWMLALEGCIQITKIIRLKNGQYKKVKYYRFQAPSKEDWKKDYYNLTVKGVYLA